MSASLAFLRNAAASALRDAALASSSSEGFLRRALGAPETLSSGETRCSATARAGAVAKRKADARLAPSSSAVAASASPKLDASSNDRSASSDRSSSAFASAASDRPSTETPETTGVPRRVRADRSPIPSDASPAVAASDQSSANGSDHGGSGVPGDVSAIATELAAARLDEPDRETSEPSSSRRDAALRLRPRLAFSRVDSDASFDARETSNEFRETPSKSPFQLLLCNDDGCEVREPRDRAIRHRQHGTPHSQFAWVEPPRNALVVKKPNDKNTTTALVRVVDMLVKKNVTPWVEPAVHWETSVGHTWSLDDDPRLDKIIDFIVCLGGDGTILWVSNLFPKAVPPVISFAMGSLGFLTAFEEESIPRAVDDVVRGDFFFTPRSRLAAHVVDKDGLEEKLRYVCLNEVVIDRGASAALVDLDVNIDGSPMTKVLADGVMISTPTGSTAYSLAAGGSMVHPGVSGVLFVPICPHTLSFRPLVLPDTSVLTVRVPESARVEPVASFDGKRQRTLRRGESLVIAGWRYPVPAICKSGETGDWFRAVKDSLLWNVRGAAQKPERVGDARA